MKTKKDWLRNFAYAESWYSKDLQAALAEWDQLEEENKGLKEAVNNLRDDLKRQNKGIMELQMEIQALKAEIEYYQDRQSC